MINHLLYPKTGDSTSINDGIDGDKVSIRYKTLDPLFQELADAQGDMSVWKADLKDAYYHVVVASKDTRLLGFSLDGTDYVDCTLNFGGRSSPYLFNLFAEAVHWILESLGICTHHYLDNFFGVAPTEQVAGIVDLVKQVCTSLGLKVSEAKTTFGPAVEILGIMVNAHQRLAWITATRHKQIDIRLNFMLVNPKLNVDDLQSLGGLLLFVSRVCPLGRAFLRGIWDAISDHRLHSPHLPIKLADDTWDDIEFWCTIFNTWNGVHIIRSAREVIEVWTNAAGAGGLGGHLGPQQATLDVFSKQHPAAGGLDIMELEAAALLHALIKWSERLEGKRVLCKIDNSVLVAAVTTGRVRH
jgi:hypothetical protein